MDVRRVGLYPVGDSTQQTNLSRATLAYQQAQTQLRNLELQIATQVRDAGRQVVTNLKRVDSARAARDLAEQRLAAEEKKFAAGIQISFFVFQAQRDLATARTAEIKAIPTTTSRSSTSRRCRRRPCIGTNPSTIAGTALTTGR